ncbi:G2/mitotic-specific cyclin [Tulasnella sp. 427]|nr:G2/mitotic-specific cyclin [Tulasnella sp. 427]
METDTVGPQASIIVWGKPFAVSADKTCSNKPHDLEDDDADDPMMVSEYANEIFEYIRKLEATVLPNPDYMEAQLELTWSARGTLADWMLALHNSLRLLPETYWLAMNLLDRFLSRRRVALAKFQLLGVTCLMAAAKYTEILAPTARQWVTSSDGSFTESALIHAERYVLKVLEFKVGSPSPLDFLRRISKVDGYDAQVSAARLVCIAGARDLIA